LPQRPRIENNVTIICIGDSLRLTYYKELATVILIKDKVNFFEVFRNLQGIFDIFDRWENKLFNIFLNDIDINNVIECSYDVFKKPIYLLDSCFQLVSSTSKQPSSLWPVFGDSISHDSVGTYLSNMDLNMDKKGAMLIKLAEGSWLCVNTFDKNNEYAGCLVIDCSESKCADGEYMLAEYLAGMVEKTYEKNPTFLNNDRNVLKEILQRLLQDLPMDSSRRLVFNALNLKDKYICLSMHHLNHLSPLPVNYICSVFEITFPNSITFEQNNAILALVNLSSLCKGGNYGKELEDKLSAFMRDMRLNVGISKEFINLDEIKIRYFQSESAVENGLLTNPGNNIYYFDDYVLTEMIINSLGGLPVEAYFPDGLKELMEHDKDSDISYLDTLKVFFDENMSYSKTASRLYIHRSTAIDRIARIEKELEVDLKDARQRLRLQIILCALDVEELMKKENVAPQK
jgi:hypothetical protein